MFHHNTVDNFIVNYSNLGRGRVNFRDLSHNLGVIIHQMFVDLADDKENEFDDIFNNFHKVLDDFVADVVTFCQSIIECFATINDEYTRIFLDNRDTFDKDHDVLVVAIVIHRVTFVENRDIVRAAFAVLVVTLVVIFVRNRDTLGLDFADRFDHKVVIFRIPYNVFRDQAINFHLIIRLNCVAFAAAFHVRGLTHFANF